MQSNRERKIESERERENTMWGDIKYLVFLTVKAYWESYHQTQIFRVEKDTGVHFVQLLHLEMNIPGLGFTWLAHIHEVIL